MKTNGEPKLSPWREKIWEVIFGTHTRAGRTFDVILLIVIIASVINVMLETVESIWLRIGTTLIVLEWIFTVFFTIEYILRLISARHPMKYVFSFFGIIDFLAIIPTYIGFLVGGTHLFAFVRTLRLIRIFRILKLAKFLKQSRVIVSALKSSQEKIAVFLVFIFLMVIILGSIMYLIEGGHNSEFSSIPKSIYWAIVTLTTVGYGDIHPITPLGQFIASLVMIMGYGIIAVPTGIVSSEMTRAAVRPASTSRICDACGEEIQRSKAKFCFNCGNELDKEE